MRFKENESIELKQIVVDDIKKEIIAFANSSGGTLYVGIADTGDVIGLSDPEQDLIRINNMIRDNIKPDVSLFVQSRIEKIDQKSIISIQVGSGTDRPYYLSGKGIRPEGVYVRHGSSSVPATNTAIRNMIRATDGESYEQLRCTLQELTFEAADLEFRKRAVPFGNSQMTTLKIINTDGLFTNLGLLLSDQCTHTVKVAVFQDTTQQLFKDRREFDRSLFTQMNDVYNYLDLHNQTQSTFDKLLRVDRRDYPQTALREALLNALIHREYSISGSTLIKIFSDRMEFISPGGLVYGMEIDDIMSGYSICRNPALAAVFYRLQLIEAYGTGILKIFEAYTAVLQQPRIEVTSNVFKLILPNLNADLSLKKSALYKSDEEKILDYTRQQGVVNRKDVEALLGVSQTSAGVVLRELTEQGYLTRVGQSRNVQYKINHK